MKFCNVMDLGKLIFLFFSCLFNLFLTRCSSVQLSDSLTKGKESVSENLEQKEYKQEKTSKENEKTSTNEINEDEDFSDELEELEELEDFDAPMIDYAAADPLERMNRVLYGLHKGVDRFFVRPIAMTYTKVFPKPAQKGFANFVRNLTAPLRALCHLLQGNVQEAGKTLGRFVMNSVVGVGGIFDVANKMGAYETPTGFNETLKKWGVQAGPYLVVPGLGPTTFRGAFGALFDSFLDPMWLFTCNRGLPGNQSHALMWGDTGVQLSSLLMARAKIDPIYEEVWTNSVDSYSKLRALILAQTGGAGGH